MFKISITDGSLSCSLVYSQFALSPIKVLKYKRIFFQKHFSKAWPSFVVVTYLWPRPLERWRHAPNWNVRLFKASKSAMAHRRVNTDGSGREWDRCHSVHDCDDIPMSCTRDGMVWRCATSVTPKLRPEDLIRLCRPTNRSPKIPVHCTLKKKKTPRVSSIGLDDIWRDSVRNTFVRNVHSSCPK